MWHFKRHPLLGFAIAVAVLASLRVVADGSAWLVAASTRTAESISAASARSSLLSSAPGGAVEDRQEVVAMAPSVGLDEPAPPCIGSSAIGAVPAATSPTCMKNAHGSSAPAAPAQPCVRKSVDR